MLEKGRGDVEGANVSQPENNLLKVCRHFGVNTVEEIAGLLGIKPSTLSGINADWNPFTCAFQLPDAFVDRFREAFGIDLYVASASLWLDVDRMPKSMRRPSAALLAHSDQELQAAVDQFKAARN